MRSSHRNGLRLVAAALVCFGGWLVRQEVRGQDLSLNVSDVSVSVLLPHPKGRKGETVAAPIKLQGAAELGALQMALIYDENLLQVVKVERGGLLPEHGLFEHDFEIPGRLGLGLLSGPDAAGKGLARINGSGEIATVYFKVLGAGPRRTPLSPDRVRAWGVSDEELTVRAAPGEFTILGTIPWFWIVLAIVAGLVLIVGIRWARNRGAGRVQGGE